MTDLFHDYEDDDDVVANNNNSNDMSDVDIILDAAVRATSATPPIPSSSGGGIGGGGNERFEDEHPTVASSRQQNQPPPSVAPASASVAKSMTSSSKKNNLNGDRLRFTPSSSEAGDPHESTASNEQQQEEIDYRMLTVAILMLIGVIGLGIGIGFGVRNGSGDSSSGGGTNGGNVTTTVEPDFPSTSSDLDMDDIDPNCIKSMNDFYTDEVMVTLNVRPSRTSTTTIETDLEYVARVFQKTYSAFVDRAAIMKGIGCDPYCRQVNDVQLEGFIGIPQDETDTNGGDSSSTTEGGDLSSTAATAQQSSNSFNGDVDETGGEACFPVQLVFTAAGTYWTGCDAFSSPKGTIDTGDSMNGPTFPGLFGIDVSSRTTVDEKDRSGWTRRQLYHEQNDDMDMNAMIADVTERLLHDTIHHDQNDPIARSLLRGKHRHPHHHRTLQAGSTVSSSSSSSSVDLTCPVCAKGSISSFSGEDLVFVMDRFVSVLPNICSLVSIGEGM